MNTKTMLTATELIAELNDLKWQADEWMANPMSRRSPEGAHGDADEALLAYINNPEVSAAFRAIERWYA